jgi:hypothetical protein
MTPKEKALELVEAMSFTCRECDYEIRAKYCAIRAVDEILNEFPQGFKGNFEERRKQYWQEVKQEIEKL